MHVPKRIHQIWMQGKSIVPEKYSDARETWKQLHADWEIQTWDEADIVPLTLGTPWEVALRLSRRLIQRADILRCVVLERYGGVYVDMDMYALQSLDPLLHEERIQVGETTFYKTPLMNRVMKLNNGIILCPPNHPFWKATFLPSLILRLQTNTILDDISTAWNTIRTTGPGLWSSFQHHPSLCLRPCKFFYSLAVPKKRKGKLTLEEREALQGSFTYHMQDSAWLDSWEQYLLQSLINNNWKYTLTLVLLFAVIVLLIRKRLRNAS